MMHSGSAIPLVTEGTLMKEALFEITAKGLGITGVTDTEGTLLGVITDGDLRRALERGEDILQATAGQLMKRGAKRIVRRELAAAALQIMERFSITSLFVFENEQDQAPCGVIHLHDLLKAGIA
jgi:arabinose-5-phosphate isomerase